METNTRSSAIEKLEEELASTQINLSTVEEENKRLQARLEAAELIVGRTIDFLNGSSKKEVTEIYDQLINWRDDEKV